MEIELRNRALRRCWLSDPPRRASGVEYSPSDLQFAQKSHSSQESARSEWPVGRNCRTDDLRTRAVTTSRPIRGSSPGLEARSMPPAFRLPYTLPGSHPPNTGSETNCRNLFHTTRSTRFGSTFSQGRKPSVSVSRVEWRHILGYQMLVNLSIKVRRRTQPTGVCVPQVSSLCRADSFIRFA